MARMPFLTFPAHRVLLGGVSMRTGPPRARRRGRAKACEQTLHIQHLVLERTLPGNGGEIQTSCLQPMTPVYAQLAAKGNAVLGSFWAINGPRLYWVV